MKSSLICIGALVVLVGCKTKMLAPTPAEIDEAEKGSATYLQTLKADDRKSYDDLKADWLKQGKSDPAATNRFYSQAVLQSQTVLGQMGYGTLFTGTVDARTRSAIMQYQKEKGIYQSGNIDPVTFFALTADEDLLNERLVTPSTYNFYGDNWNEYFSADGGWDYRNQAGSWPVSSHIECSKSESLCTESDGTEASIFGFTSVQATSTVFRITKWSDYELDAENIEPCEKDQMVIVRDEKSVTMHMISTQPDSISCHKLMGDASVLDAHLVDGTEINKAHRDDVQKRRAALYQFSDAAKKILEPSK